MKRVACVVLCAVLTASISGVSGASAVRAQPVSGSAQQQEIAAQLKRIPVGSVVRIEQADGRRLEAVLQSVTADAIVVAVLDGQTTRQETIPMATITRIERLGGHTLRNILIGMGIGAAVLVGACAVALNNVEEPSVKPEEEREMNP